MSDVVNLSIVKLLNEQFGVQAQFEPNLEDVPARMEKNTYGTAYYTIDEFGREVFLPITFTYTDDNGTEQQIVLHYAVVGIRGRNHIIKTPLTERRGTFKELISGDDWMIDVKGYLINGTNDLPEEKMKQLIAMSNVRTNISMKHAITDFVLKNTDNKGEDKVVIEELDFPPVTGVQNVKPFYLALVSDTDFNLEEIE